MVAPWREVDLLVVAYQEERDVFVTLDTCKWYQLQNTCYDESPSARSSCRAINLESKESHLQRPPLDHLWDKLSFLLQFYVAVILLHVDIFVVF